MDQPQTGAASTTSTVTAKCSSSRCWKKPSSSLLFCARCKKARYCNKECQKKHWEEHKPFCQPVATEDPEAQALAREIGLPSPTDGFVSLRMGGLVATGKDTPENLTLFFSRQCEHIKQWHEEHRMEVLLCPAPGSIMHAESQNRGFEAIWPRSGWTQREPSAAKARMVEQIRDMQERVRR
ncbi:hypothetical protein MGN70_003879 [Eutypa lata]|nr:hypothetical protein MGN70_003879 [Eutypa lata]